MGVIETFKFTGDSFIMLPDVLKPNLKLIFCGTAAGTTSALRKQYYAGPGNKFWKVLYQIGLIPSLLIPSQYEEVLKYDIGLTDLVKSKSGMDSVLSAKDFGDIDLTKKIKLYQPKYICFNGKKAAKEFLCHDIDYGLQNELIGITKFFVAPSTSGAANRWWNIEPWKEIKKLCNMK